MINWFICWLFGHEPASSVRDVFEFAVMLDEQEVSYLTFCTRCDVILTYDEKNEGWIKW